MVDFGYLWRCSARVGVIMGARYILRGTGMWGTGAGEGGGHNFRLPS